MGRALIILGAVLAIVLIVGVAVYSFAAGYYNRFVTMEEEINQAQAEINNQLQRRFDLIPNLVKTVEGFAAQERAIIEEIAQARTKYGGAVTLPDKLSANDQLSSALGRLLVIAENYPTLKSDQTFIRLMDELAGTENRLTVARMRYNQSVQQYNVAVRQFPGNVLAGFFGFARQQYYQVPEAAKEAPKVEFPQPGK